MPAYGMSPDPIVVIKLPRCHVRSSRLFVISAVCFLYILLSSTVSFFSIFVFVRYNTLNSVHKSDYIDAVSIAGIPNKFQIFFGYFSYFLARIASIKDPQNTDG